MFCQENNNKNFCRSMLISGKHILNGKKNREKLSDYVKPQQQFFSFPFFEGWGQLFVLFISVEYMEAEKKLEIDGREKVRKCTDVYYKDDF